MSSMKPVNGRGTYVIRFLVHYISFRFTSYPFFFGEQSREYNFGCFVFFCVYQINRFQWSAKFSTKSPRNQRPSLCTRHRFDLTFLFMQTAWKCFFEIFQHLSFHIQVLDVTSFLRYQGSNSHTSHSTSFLLLFVSSLQVDMKTLRHCHLPLQIHLPPRFRHSGRWYG